VNWWVVLPPVGSSFTERERGGGGGGAEEEEGGEGEGETEEEEEEEINCLVQVNRGVSIMQGEGNERIRFSSFVLWSVDLDRRISIKWSKI
jgi:hypothetical protein